MSICFSNQGQVIVEGFVRASIVVIDEQETKFDQAEGKIVILRMATPSIVLWLRKAAGLIVEKGGITSHGAIMAREFDIPSIIGIPNIYDKSYEGKMGEIDTNRKAFTIWDR